MGSKVAVSRSPGIAYPAPGALGPPEAYPEYPYKHLGRAGLAPSNTVYALVRRCLHDYGCDEARWGTPEWNPLGAWIDRGQRVFVLPNFVAHTREGESREDFASKCTHASVLRAVLDYAAIATGSADLVAFGNAPIQSCDFGRVVAETGASSIASFYADLGHPAVGPHDLRLLVSKVTRLRAIIERRFVNLHDRVDVDLRHDSLLEELYGSKDVVDFRAGDYPPADTMAHHGRGKHVYVVNGRVLDADVIISVPKLKTHERVGITCALKGTVGAIGLKECLAHHRLGSPEREGDEYPRRTVARDLSSSLSDYADRLGTDAYSNTIRVASKVLGRILRSGDKGIMLGMWHGNDTAWRMTLDIARVLRFAARDGTLQKTPVRKHIAFVDGVVGGEGAGPLRPRAHHAGAVLFGDDAACVDAAAALVMGFDPRRIRLVANAFRRMAYPVSDHDPNELATVLDGEPVDPRDLPRRFAPAFVPPKGWRGHIESVPDSPSGASRPAQASPGRGSASGAVV